MTKLAIVDQWTSAVGGSITKIDALTIIRSRA